LEAFLFIADCKVNKIGVDATSVRKRIPCLLTDLINQHGPDSLIAKIGATMFGSTETTFYVLAVYFGSVGIRKTRHALVAGLFAYAVGVFSAVYICRFFFG
jgi:spore maturation protein B